MVDNKAPDDDGKLLFVLSQLRDDLDDIIEGLKSGAITSDVAKDGAATQIRWVLNQLKAS